MKPKGFFEKFLYAFGKVLSKPGNEKSAAAAVPLFQWLLKKPERYRLDFAWQLAAQDAWLLKDASARILGGLALPEHAERLRLAFEDIASAGGLSVDAAARGMAAAVQRGLGGSTFEDCLEFYFEGRPLAGREAAVLSLGALFPGQWPSHKEELIKAMEWAACDENGRVHRHVGAGLLGRLLYAKDPPAVRELIKQWKTSSNEKLQVQALRFFISPAGNDPQSGAQSGLEAMARDGGIIVKNAAQLALEKQKG